MNSRLVRRSATAAVVLALAAASSSATGVEPLNSARAAQGAPGIGDPYFPLDGNGGIDVLRYRIVDAYRFGDRHLSGKTRITLRATQDLETFNLDFLLPVQGVTVAGRVAGYGRSPSQRHELVVTPAQPLQTGEKVDVVVRYAGYPERFGYLGERNWLASDREVVTMNQPHMAPWWFPANDHPQDRAFMDIVVTVPHGKQVIANGRRVSRRVHGDKATYRWKSDERMVPYLAFFAAGRFEIAQGSRDGLPWLVAVSRQLSDGTQRSAMTLMKKTPGIVSWLEKRLGPYPFSQTGGLVTNLQPGFALENQTRPTYPGVVSHTTVVHELAHQWFGDSVAVREWRDIWLNEGFASFMEHAYDEAKLDRDAQEWLETAWDTTDPSDDFWNLAIGDPGPHRIFAWPVYQRGAMTLQALRHRIGDATFWNLLREWAALRAGGNGATEDFHALAEELSGEDLDGFFQAWLFSTVRPDHTADNGF